MALNVAQIWRHARPAQSQVIVFFYAVIVAAALVHFSARQIRNERETAASEALRYNALRADALKLAVTRTLQIARIVAPAMADDTRRKSLRVADSDRFRQILGLHRLKLGMGAVIFVGRGTVDQLGDRLRSASLDELQRIVRNRTNDQLVTPPLVLRNGSHVVGVIHPYFGDDQVLLVQPTRLLEATEGSLFNSKDLVSVIGMDGITRARREADRITDGEDLTGKLVMRQQAQHPNGTYFGPSGVDGIPRIFSHRRIAEYGIFVTSGMGPENLSVPLEKRRQTYLKILSLSLLVLVTAAAIAIEFIGRKRLYLRRIKRINARLIEAQSLAGMGDWDYFPEKDALIWGDNLCRIYGQPLRLTPLSAIRSFSGEESYGRIRANLEDIVATRKGRTYEVIARTASGHCSHRQIVVSPVLRADGSVERIHGVDKCIDDEARLRKLQAHHSASDRLNSMNALAATIAHELNQPLGVAMNYISAARRRLVSPPDDLCRNLLDRAIEQIDAVSSIVDATRQNVTPSEFESIDLSEEINRAMILFRGHSREFELELQQDLASDAKTVTAQKSLVKQVVHNLLKNAVDAVPEDRTPRVVIKSRLHMDKQMVVISLSDNGEGLGMQNPFESLQTRKEHGLGLGLALSRTIVEGQGGRIWVESTSRQGTIMSFSLPVGEPHLSAS